MDTVKTSVVIDLSDDKKYASVAFLVDRDDFLRDVAKLRKKVGFKQILSYDNLKSWNFYPWRWPGADEYPKGFVDELRGTADMLQNIPYLDKLTYKKKIKLKDKHDKLIRQDPAQRFFYLIQDLRIKYKRPSNFDQVIAHAVLYGKVTESDYKTVEIGITKPEWDYIPYEQDATPTITFYPLATPQEIETIFRTRSKQILEEYQANYAGAYMNYDTRGEIRRDREWYWLQKKLGKTYREITEFAATKKIHITQKGVLQAIRSYRKALNRPL